MLVFRFLREAACFALRSSTYLSLSQAQANRQAQPWIIVSSHRPIYTPNHQKSGNPTGYAKNLQTFLEGLFKKYSVDIYFSGKFRVYFK